MPGHYGNKPKKKAPTARPTKSKKPVMNYMTRPYKAIGKAAKAVANRPKVSRKKK